MKKQFKAESKKLMDLMINSIYTNKDIFLREIISNASDAIDKLYYNSLTDESILLKKKDYFINIKTDVNERTITISDNGIGMTKDELETNLGTIAKSGSLDFKENNEHKKNIDIIGQFGVGFYSAIMVASKVEVISKKYGSDEANKWVSEGIDGYSIEKAEKATNGTDIIITLKENTEDEHYDDFLNQDTIARLVKMYSNYITYPIKMSMVKRDWNETKKEYDEHTEIETLNDMIPLWKKSKSSIKDDDYNNFYKDKFNDFENPQRVIHTSAEGLVSFNSLLFIPSNTPYDFYTKDYEKGLKLYSNGVLIMDKCKDLLPDYYSFVKGVVDTPDLSLNISREMLQQDRSLKVIAKNIESKIKKELLALQNDDRDEYVKFFKNFGMNIKFNIYNDFGMKKDELQDLLVYESSKDKKFITLKEYADRVKDKDQKNIYYVCGESVEKISKLPIVEEFKDKDIEVLFCTNYMDEFVMQTIREYDGLKVLNITSDKVDLSSEEEKEELKKKNEEASDMFKLMADSLSDVSSVKFTNKLKNHPVCLTSEGDISIEMEKVINAMPTDEHIDAKKVLEINESHDIAKKIKELYDTDKEALKDYTKILYAQARLIEGLPIDNPTEITNLICEKLSK
ncbi:MAG: molecular chaperone HtpG [Bacilli bacterium]|nr:molecular chaperone HtpG [Bacilli bacterium]